MFVMKKKFVVSF